MFLGDCYYPPPLHLRTPESEISMSMLAALECKEYALYVEGHRNPVKRATIRRRLKQHS
jgi:hypothetical protein